MSSDHTFRMGRVEKYILSDDTNTCYIAEVSHFGDITSLWGVTRVDNTGGQVLLAPGTGEWMMVHSMLASKNMLKAKESQDG